MFIRDNGNVRINVGFVSSESKSELDEIIAVSTCDLYEKQIKYFAEKSNNKKIYIKIVICLRVSHHYSFIFDRSTALKKFFSIKKEM